MLFVFSSDGSTIRLAKGEKVAAFILNFFINLVLFSLLILFLCIDLWKIPQSIVLYVEDMATRCFFT